MKLEKGDQQKIGFGLGAFFIILLLVFVYGKMKGREENESREIDVTVDITDQNGQASTYDPNPLLIRLNKGLITRYYFDFSERCIPLKELYALDSIRFMATVKAYETKYGVSIITHIDDCNVGCDAHPSLGSLGYFSLVKNRIDTLKDIIV
jgi:hypothetical protein